MRIAFDIGGWISRYPDLTGSMMECLSRGGAEVVVMTDMPEAEARQLLERNGFLEGLHYARIISVDWTLNHERSKAVACRAEAVDLLIDDYAPYCAGEEFAALMVWPEHEHPYDHPNWKRLPIEEFR